MSGIVGPGDRPGPNETLGDHQRRIRALEAGGPDQIDSTENVGLPWGVQSIEADGTPEDENLFLAAIGDGGSTWKAIGQSGTSLADVILAEPCLVGFWKLDEADGVVAHDSGPGAYDLSVFPNAAQWGQPPGPPGSTSALFGPSSGSTGFSGAIPILSSGLTLEIWANKPVSDPDIAAGYMFGQGYPVAAGNRGVAMYWQNSSGSNKGSVFVGDTTGGPHQIDTNSGLTEGDWYHLVAVRDTNIWTQYVNGVAQSQTFDDSGTNYSPVSTGDIRIGNSGVGIPLGTQFFNGYLSYAAVYGCALTAAAVENHYAVGVSGTADSSMVFSGTAAYGEVITAQGDGTTLWQQPTIEIEY